MLKPSWAFSTSASTPSARPSHGPGPTNKPIASKPYGLLDAANRLANDYWLSVTALEAAALAAHLGNLRPAARLYGYVRAWREERASREAGDARIQATIERLLSGGLSADEGALRESLGAKLGAADVSELVLSVVDSVTREESDS